MTGLLPLLVLALAACAQMPERTERSGESIDGAWQALAIDGRPVGRTLYTVNVERGRVTGGRDGCNHWGYQWEEGRRLVVSTLIGCHSDPLQAGYWAVVGAEPWAPEPRPDGTMQLRAAGHSALFRRAVDGDR